MKVQILKSKIYRGTVTDAQLDYEGSIAIDEEIYTKAGMNAFEKVLVVNVNNGARFETYIIKGKKGSKEICLNGAAARLCYKGDVVIIMSFASIDESQIRDDYAPTVIKLDEKNNIIS
ncbi:MAG: aspartate 1-decarboxylase [Spirochaetes bacterium]|nr:aspartate 1-decarboxylase [Spirochaetota bacterium]